MSKNLAITFAFLALALILASGLAGGSGATGSRADNGPPNRALAYQAAMNG